MRRRSGIADRGFTLVEMVVVVSMLGLLATITVFAVRGVTEQGESSACATEMRQLASTQEVYHAEFGDFGTLAELVAAGRLRAPSSLFSVTVAADGQGFTLTGLGQCTGLTTTTGTPP